MAAAEQIETIALHETTKTRYLNYAMSVITSRALPDIRDGLKPVQRRILYTMYHNLKLTHDAKHRKSAAVVGEVMGKYHPHGDSSIYDAMVRMAQDFSLRYPLVDGQGNFGSIDGDPAAAMRYTEARLQSLSSELISEIGKNTVGFQPNYDGEHQEPVVLPAQLPNLILNGAMGIAVGMATNIPPHNLREIVKACVALIDNEDASNYDLLRYVRGPDFPTGGKMLNTDEDLLSIYETGRGSIKLAGEYDIEKDGRKRFIVIRSIPYAVNKSQLIEKIGEHILKGKVPQLKDVRDESKDDIRIVLELSSKGDPEVAMAYLYKNTPLQSKVHVNMTCLVPDEEDGTIAPRRVSLVEMLNHFLDFRMDVVEARLQYDLDVLERRIHILEGFAKIFNDLDKAIEIIRASENRRHAAEGLMEYFAIDQVQADAILDIRLYRLAKMEIDAILEELADKESKADALRALLADEPSRWQLIKDELLALSKKYGDKRRTVLESPEQELEFSAEDYIVSERTYVIVTRQGRVKRQKSYSALSSIRIKDNDEVGWALAARTTDTVVFFTSHGQAYSILVDKIQSTTGYGEFIQTSFDFADGETVVGVVTSNKETALEVPEELKDRVSGAPPPPYLVAMSRNGAVIRFPLCNHTDPSTSAGRKFMRLSDAVAGEENDAVIGVYRTSMQENVCLASRKGRGLIFAVTDIPLLRGAGRGVSAIKLAKGDWVMGFVLSAHRKVGLNVETSRGRAEIVRTTKYRVTSRNGRGRPMFTRGYLARVDVPPVQVTFSEGEDEELLEEEDTNETEESLDAMNLVLVEDIPAPDPSEVRLPDKARLTLWEQERLRQAQKRAAAAREEAESQISLFTGDEDEEEVDDDDDADTVDEKE